MGPPRAMAGTAGWSIPKTCAGRFAAEGTHLERYARVLACAEINSSFHRPHAASTYARWAASVPEGFRFSIKMPRTLTHDQKLRRPRLPLERFLSEIAGLGATLGPILVQLPPSLAFERRLAARFFDVLCELHKGSVVCEPRHATWFSPAADALLTRRQVARVAADPPPVPGAERPGGWGGLVYYRMHGSPRKYWSRYEPSVVRGLAETLRSSPVEAWCMFDNTASGAALENAWELQAALAGAAGPVAGL